MRVAWDKSANNMWTAIIGSCVIILSEKEWFQYQPGDVRGNDWTYGVRFYGPYIPGGQREVEVLDEGSFTVERESWRGGEEQAKDRVVEIARHHVRCKRARIKREYDEEWLTELAEDMLPTIQRAQERYDMEKKYNRYGAIDLTKFFPSTGYFVGNYNPDENAHYLGRGHTPAEIRRAVNVVLRRLESAGTIEGYTSGHNRYWMPK